MNPWKKGPVDVIDLTCQIHDNCYGEVQKHPVIKLNNFITPCHVYVLALGLAISEDEK